MLYRMSICEIPPLFVELNMLNRDKDEKYDCWKEKARWIRFEENAEDDVLGRWSKPHVATITHQAIDELSELASSAKTVFGATMNSIKDLADITANELLDSLNLTDAQHFAELMCLPFVHHHEKHHPHFQNVKKIPSGNSLARLNMSSSELHPIKENQTMPVLPVNKIEANGCKSRTPPSNSMNNFIAKHQVNQIKYQYSFTDSLSFVEEAAFKENTKFKKKVHRKSEGASILVMPVDFVEKTKMVFIRLAAAVELHGLLEVKVRSRFIIVIVGPLSKKMQLYEIGRAMSASIADDVCRELFYSAEDRKDVAEAVQHFNQSTLVIPPSEWNPKIKIEPPETYLSKEERQKVTEMAQFVHDTEVKIECHSFDPTLIPSLRPCFGLVQDIERKLKYFVSDFTDSLNLQSVAAILYMYLVSLCSLVAFGGLFGQKTENYMATMECILAGAICGALFSLFSGQPLNIISATGPVLILEGIIKGLCDTYHIEFMEFRLWIGVWIFVLLLILVVFNLSFLVKYITRFTEDCFATLVAIVFIIDAIKNVINMRNGNQGISLTTLGPSLVIAADPNSTYLDYPSYTTEASSTKTTPIANPKEGRSVFYFSVLLFLLTFFICTSLTNFRKKPYLPSKIRQTISDFSVLIAIVVTSFIDFYMGENTLKLIIPSQIHPTRDDRSWLIPFFSGKNSWLTIIIAIVPAIIATILIFMDQQITAVIANRKELKLKKSHGYHLDLLIVAICILASSLFGLPWFVAATVLTLTHINSLKVMSENPAPGEIPAFIGIREQRGTTFVVSILIGLSVFLNKILSHIPMAALYGVFMFMGVSAMHGMQFFERVKILFMPAKYQPSSAIYLRHVRTHRVHLFTIIQLLSTGALYLIKYIDLIAISFPILIVATCGIRKMLDYVFSQRELYWLDDILPGRRKSIAKSNSLRRKSKSGPANLNNMVSMDDCMLNSNHKDDSPCIAIDENYVLKGYGKDDASIPFIDTNSPMVMRNNKLEAISVENGSSPSPTQTPSHTVQFH